MGRRKIEIIDVDAEVIGNGNDTTLVTARPRAQLVKVKRPQQRRQEETIKYFSREELRRILSIENKANDYKSWFLCYFLTHTACRISEAVSTYFSDINWDAKTIKIRTLKRNNHWRIIPLQEQVLNEIIIWQKRNHLSDNDPIFSYGRKMADIRIKRLCNIAGFNDERCHCHSFRHSWAVNAISQSVPISIVSQVLGHSNILTTTIYLKLCGDGVRTFINKIEW